MEDWRRRKSDREVNGYLTRRLSGLHNYNQQQQVSIFERLAQSFEQSAAMHVSLIPPRKDTMSLNEKSASIFQDSVDLDFLAKATTPLTATRLPSYHTMDPLVDEKLSGQASDAAHAWISCRWADLQVGDIIQVREDEQFPADLALLSSSSIDGSCFVETKSLDGETSLKSRSYLPVKSPLHTKSGLASFKACFDIEAPHHDLYRCDSTLKQDCTKSCPVLPENMLYRGCALRNTAFVCGVVCFTGKDTKVMLSIGRPPSAAVAG